MALPATLDPTAPATGDAISGGDDQIRNFKQLIADVFGLVTSPTQITAAAFSISAGGVVTVSQAGAVFQAGTAAAPAWLFSGDSNTGPYQSAADKFDIACGGLNVLELGFTASVAEMLLTSTDAGAQGPVFKLVHNSASPAASDVIGTVDFRANDSGATERIVCQINAVFDDVTSTTMDSHMGFAVMNAANAVAANTTATLSSLGVWTDSSSAAIKDYIDNHITGSVIEKLKQLKTLGVYRAKGTPAEKTETAETHFSPTAEDFYEVFGLGIHPSRAQFPGIAPKDPAWIACAGLLELHEEMKAMAARIDMREAA